MSKTDHLNTIWYHILTFTEIVTVNFNDITNKIKKVRKLHEAVTDSQCRALYNTIYEKKT